jgi:hypothetical protein
MQPKSSTKVEMYSNERRNLITGSVVTISALFTISEHHATYGALSVLAAIPIFLAIAYKSFNFSNIKY